MRSTVFVLIGLLLVSGFLSAVQETDDGQTTGIAAPENQWDLRDLYQTVGDWEKDFARVESELGSIKAYEGKLIQSDAALLDCLKQNERINKTFGRVFLYAELLQLKDQGNDTYGEMLGKARDLGSLLNEAFSFVPPEIVSMPAKTIEGFFKKNPKLKPYRHFIMDIRRMKEHTCPKETESLLASFSPLRWAPFTSFSTLTGSDMKFPVIKDDRNQEVTVNRSRNYSAMFSTDRDYRRRSYEAFLGQYKQFGKTLSSILNSHVKTQVFLARAKRYRSVLEANLFPDKIPTSVYDSLLSSIGNNVSVLRRWGRLKKQRQKLEVMYPYDTYVTLFPSSKRKYSYEEAKEMALKALAPLGEEYVRVFRHALENNWVDVFEQKGKASGAMCRARYGAEHPYVLMNYAGDLQDVFTFVHEMGHALYRYYSFKNQNLYTAYYSSFTSEVAAILNETLLSEYLISRASTREEKMALMEERIYRFQLDFFQMTRTAEFEKSIYEMAERGGTLTEGNCSDLYKKLYQKYWGNTVDPGDLIASKWSVWPHMYFNFYIYQYGTSLAAAEQIAVILMDRGDEAVERYIDFLKAGSSDYPIPLLRAVGVDMSSSAPFEAIIKKMDSLLDQLERYFN